MVTVLRELHITRDTGTVMRAEIPTDILTPPRRGAILMRPDTNTETDHHRVTVMTHIGTDHHRETVTTHIGTDRHTGTVTTCTGTDRHRETVTTHIGTDRHRETVTTHIGTDRHTGTVTTCTGTDRHRETVMTHIGTDHHRGREETDTRAYLHHTTGLVLRANLRFLVISFSLFLHLCDGILDWQKNKL